MGNFIKRAAVNIVGLTIGRYAAKTALTSPAARKILTSAISKSAHAVGGMVHKQVSKHLPAPVKPSLPSADDVRHSVARAQTLLADAQVAMTRIKPQINVSKGNRLPELDGELANTLVSENVSTEKQDSEISHSKAHPVLKGAAVAAGVTAGVAAGVAVLAAFAVAPRIKGSKALQAHWDEFKKYRYAHRGLHDIDRGIPENSLAAFRRAVEHDFGSELDVHLTADGHLVVIHDSDLSRLCGVNDVVENCTLDRLKTYRLLDTEEGIPTFDEVLSCYDWNGEDQLPAPLIVEVKTRGGNAEEVTKQVMRVLDEHSVRAAVESFDPMVLRWLRIHRPEVLRGQLAENFFNDSQVSDLSMPKKAAATALLGNSLGRPDFIAYRFEDRKNLFVDATCHKMKAHLITWTIRSERDLLASEAEGAPGIFEGFIPTARSLVSL